MDTSDTWKAKLFLHWKGTKRFKNSSISMRRVGYQQHLTSIKLWYSLKKRFQFCVSKYHSITYNYLPIKTQQLFLPLDQLGGLEARRFKNSSISMRRVGYQQHLTSIKLWYSLKKWFQFCVSKYHSITYNYLPIKTQQLFLPLYQLGGLEARTYKRNWFQSTRWQYKELFWWLRNK